MPEEVLTLCVTETCQWQTVVLTLVSHSVVSFLCSRCDTNMQREILYGTPTKQMFMLFCSQDNKCYVPLAKKIIVCISNIRLLFTTSDLIANCVSYS